MLTAPPQCALQAQCLPLHLQLTNARAFSGLHRTAVGSCQLTCLRQWVPENAAPSPFASSTRSQKRRCAVPAQAIHPESPVWDVVALGQSMVDISAYVSDVFIEQMGVAKGARRCGADSVLELHCLLTGSGILQGESFSLCHHLCATSSQDNKRGGKRSATRGLGQQLLSGIALPPPPVCSIMCPHSCRTLT